VPDDRCSGGDGDPTLRALRVLPCLFPVASFTVKPHWHARYHHDAGNRWLGGVRARLSTE
jgi:hypothetical protein